MFRSALFLCGGLVIVLVNTNPVLQGYPGTYCDQIAYRNSLAELPSIHNPTFISPRSDGKYQDNDQLYKLFYDRIAENPSALDIIQNFQRYYNHDDISNYVKNSGKIPDIVNNYFILPPEIKKENDLPQINSKFEYYNKNKNTCSQVNENQKKINITCNNVTNFEHKMHVFDNPQAVSKAERITEKKLENAINNNGSPRHNIGRTLKRSLEEKKKSKQKNKDNSKTNMNQKQRLIHSNSPNHNIHKKINKMEVPDTSRQEEIMHSPDESLNRYDEKNNNRKRLVSSNKSEISNHKEHGASQNHSTKLRKTVGMVKNNEFTKKNQLEEENNNKRINKQLNVSSNGRHKKQFNSKGINKNKQKGTPINKVNNEYNDIYKYIDALLSNYQLTNTNFKNEFPINYNDFYQLSQPTIPWNSINTNKNNIVPHKRRKLQRVRGRRLNKKRGNFRNKQSEGKLTDNPLHLLNTTSSYSKDTKPTSQVNVEERIGFPNKFLNQTNMISLEKLQNNFTNVPEEFVKNNNSFSKEYLRYNSRPSFVIDIEDTVPIIFENDFIDDYYPDFTADNDALHMTPEENYAKIYKTGKYHFVSNQNFNLEDYINKRKGVAMHNMNQIPNSKLFFSEKGRPEDVMISNQDTDDDEEVDKTIKFQSPPLLDNPDFRTRKIESNEIYEPYYYHNVFHDPNEDFNKYYSDKKEIVYPTTVSLKNNVKNKLCNEIDDSSKSKWKKLKDSNVETVYAHSKLAKYGLVL